MRFFQRFTWLHVFLVSALVALLAGAYTYLGRPAAFTATASLLLSDRPDIVSGVVAGTGQAPEAARSIERLLNVLRSRALRLALVRQFQLDSKLGVPEGEAVELLGQMSMPKALGADGITIAVTCRGFRVPQLAWGPRLPREEARRLCADLANAYVSQLREHVRQADLEHARQVREFLQARQQELTEQLAATEDELEGLRRDYELVDPQDKASRVSERIRAVEQAYADATAEVSSTRQSLRAAESQLDAVQVRRISSEAQVRNPVLGTLEGRLADLQVQMATELARGKTQEHRDVQQLQAAIADIERQLATTRETVLKEMAEQINPTHDTVAGRVIELHIALAGAQARQRRYASLLAAARAELGQLPPVARSYVEITRRQQLQAEQLAAVDKALWAAQVEEQRSTTIEPFAVLDQAAPPVRHRGPPTLLATLAGFGAVLLVLGTIIMDRRWFGG